MKFKGSIEINKPRDLVVKYFADPSYLGECQDGFVEKTLISGNSGDDGAVSRMYYKQGGRELELTETIISNQLPDSFEASYHHIHMDNFMRCKFIELAVDKTKYEYEFEYTRVNWIMPKLMAIFFPSVYRKQGEKWMRQFKEFVEKQ